MKRMWSEEELEEMIQEQGGGGGEVTASDIDSGEATAGQVLKANGNGGAEWGDAGGEEKLYGHIVTIGFGTNFPQSIKLASIVYTKSSTQFDKDTFNTWLNNAQDGNNTYAIPVASNAKEYNSNKVVIYNIYRNPNDANYLISLSAYNLQTGDNVSGMSKVSFNSIYDKVFEVV